VDNAAGVGQDKDDSLVPAGVTLISSSISASLIATLRGAEDERGAPGRGARDARAGPYTSMGTVCDQRWALL